VKAVARTLSVSRSNLYGESAAKRRGRKPLCEERLVSEVKALIAELPTYGYRRIHALLRKRHLARGEAPPNHKRVYRIMKKHSLLLERHTGLGMERQHDGKVAVPERNTRWCSDGFEIPCDNGERVRVAFSLDCCDREAMSWVATTGGIDGGLVRDLMVQSIEHRFGAVPPAPVSIEWLTDNGSAYLANETRKFARELGLTPRTTPLESPQSNGMAEAFVKTFKRDYARVKPTPDAQTVLEQLSGWFEHYNQHHPHKALRYRSPREFIREKLGCVP